MLNFLPKYRTLVVVITSSLMGLVFGAALQKARVWIPTVIQAQFVFRNNTMLMMFLSASACSAIVLNSLKLIPSTRNAHDAAVSKHRRPRGLVALISGGVLLGFGMQMSGSCPGTVWVQAGANVPRFGAVWSGGIVGATVFGFAHSFLKQSGVLAAGPKTSWCPSYLPGRFSGYYFGATIFWGLMIFNFACQFKVPEQAWHPILSGLIVGLLQIPAVLVVGELLGSSQTYVTVSGALLAVCFGRDRLPQYLQKFAKLTIAVYWQVVYGVFVVFGSFLLASQNSAVAQHIPLVESFIGGFLLVFGSRLASGCTSGHGISGLGTLATPSFAAVSSMFAGGIGLALLRNSLNF
jgi:uncharacterized membrane protein YedE/YeeE